MGLEKLVYALVCEIFDLYKKPIKCNPKIWEAFLKKNTGL